MAVAFGVALSTVSDKSSCMMNTHCILEPEYGIHIPLTVCVHYIGNTEWQCEV